MSNNPQVLHFRFVIIAITVKSKFDLRGSYMSEYALLNYYIPITDTALELSVFWPSDTESRINELRFLNSYHYPLKRG